ncbi:MAG: dolichyl-phosphate beta-D-mannosyltransferase, partial [Candidatus Zixiibacteriota bacterium]
MPHMKRKDSGVTAAQPKWRLARNEATVVGLVGALFVLRLVFAAIIDLLPEEAYYWNYAQHLDFGYLDHPPMVAWLIHLSTAVLGNTEFAVRLPALLGWFVFAWFMYRLTVDLAGKAAGGIVLVFAAVLPIYFSIGILMTPDAPFYVCWAACLYFLERALIADETKAWWWVGVSFGLGMLSKYTMGLLLPAAVVFVLVEADSRRWLKRPEPYLAVVIGFLIFSPVLIWNYHHDWMSFSFQGPRRWGGGIRFSEHVLLAWAVILLSPVGFVEAVRALVRLCRKRLSVVEEATAQNKRRLFMLVFSLVPLSVFVLHSVQAPPKLNWTGPVWLAVLPAMAVLVNQSGKTAATW